MTMKKVKVNQYYSISRSASQYVCHFHVIEPFQQEEVVKTYPCLLSMYTALTDEGECSELLMIAIQRLLKDKSQVTTLTGEQ